mmetsp:Transcript_29904/g.53111  ORF Transcript_29904/g.53111 Transcript_29904/m.53111 type:complete len:175 (-) Transcript_29904:25-549(-)
MEERLDNLLSVNVLRQVFADESAEHRLQSLRSIVEGIPGIQTTDLQPLLSYCEEMQERAKLTEVIRLIGVLISVSEDLDSMFKLFTTARRLQSDYEEAQANRRPKPSDEAAEDVEVPSNNLRELVPIQDLSQRPEIDLTKTPLLTAEEIEIFKQPCVLCREGRGASEQAGDARL